MPRRPRLAALALAGFVALAVWAAAGQAIALCRRAADRTGPGVDYARRFDAVLEHLPREGPSVDPFGVGIPIVGYITAAEMMGVTYEQGMADAAVKQRAERAFLHYMLTQQALVPRIVALPSTPLYEHARFVVGNYESPEHAVDLSGAGFEPVSGEGSEVVLWRRQ